MAFNHISVLLNETIEMLNIKPDGIYVDGTLGGAGHSYEICKRISNGRLIGIDQDIDAINAAKLKLKEFEDKVTIVKNNFSNIDTVLEDLGISKIDGILLDIGVSSFQLDEVQRGFSFQNDAPLDMRMNKESDFSALNVVNEYSYEELSKVIFEYGEEKFSRKIAKYIVEAREKSQITTTGQLVEIIKKAMPAAELRKGHPAKKTFQAIRIEVNHELEVLKRVIEKIVNLLNTNGRICIITFHSLEDRIVKRAFNELSNPCTCPPHFPKCVCNKIKVLDVITKKPIVASDEELNINTRSHSAKLRVAQKC